MACELAYLCLCCVVRFSVMCYNVLSDKYATRQVYGYCPTWALKWEYRRNNIMGEMKESRADIFCLQVRIYNGWLLQINYPWSFVLLLRMCYYRK